MPTSSKTGCEGGSMWHKEDTNRKRQEGAAQGVRGGITRASSSTVEGLEAPYLGCIDALTNKRVAKR